MKRPTLADVAKAASVSRSAAARVLLGTGGDHVRVAPATRQRIEAAAQHLRYAPNRSAQQLRGISSKTIGVVLNTQNLPVMSQRLFALEAEASRRGWRLLIGHTRDQPESLRDYVADFTGRASEAIFCLFDLAPGRDELARQCFGDLKNVVFHARPAWAGGYCVRVDTEFGIGECVDHLVKSGRKSPALCLWNSARDELMVLREKAFRQRIQHHGLRGFVWDAPVQSPDPSPAVLDQGIDFLVHQCQADAILASNDIVATRFILQLQKQGLRVPEDVAIIGYDNLDIASVVSPTLTTVDQCHETYAQSALGLLEDIAFQRAIPRDQCIRTVRPRLILRESA